MTSKWSTLIVFTFLYAITAWSNLKKELDKLAQTNEIMSQIWRLTVSLYLQRKQSTRVCNGWVWVLNVNITKRLNSKRGLCISYEVLIGLRNKPTLCHPTVTAGVLE